MPSERARRTDARRQRAAALRMGKASSPAQRVGVAALALQSALARLARRDQPAAEAAATTAVAYLLDVTERTRKATR